MTIDKQIAGLIETASRLIDLMEREVAILRAMRPSELEDLQEEKTRLVAAYEDWFRVLSDKRDALALVAPALRQEFKDVAGKFESALAENARALTATKAAHERMICAIVDAVKAERNQAGTYSASGVSESTATGTTAMSLSLDCRL